MIKIGSNTITQIKLGGTTVTKVALGSTTVYPAGGPPPATTLLEGFEATPFTGLFADWDVVFAGPTVTRTASHVTQGSFSWESSGSALFTGIKQPTPWNLGAVLPAPTLFAVDVFIQTMPAGGTLRFSIFDDNTGNTDSAATAASATGAFTLQFAPSNVTDFSAVFFQISASPISGAVDFYADNLRAS
jgi:hypothetical protein